MKKFESLNKGKDEIDLSIFVKTILKNWRILIKGLGIFMVFGVIVAIQSKSEFKSSCKLLPENQEGMDLNLGGLGSLAGLAGINLDMGTSGGISPELYPEIVKSIPFQMEILHHELHFGMNDTIISSYSYFENVYSPSFLTSTFRFIKGFPGYIKNIFTSQEEQNIFLGKDRILQLSEEDWEIILELQERVEVYVDNNTGIITVTTLMPDPYATAELSDLVVNKLTEKLTNYKTEKVENNLEFIRERYKEAEADYKEKQRSLALCIFL
jgi:hypothetical protein